MKYRLGIDVGTTSLGWCVLELKNGIPARIERLGVRIFSDGRNAKTLEPLSVSRRNARNQRRRRDRYLRRRERLMDCLINSALMPSSEPERKDLERLNPYEIRAKALDQKVSLHELGRALFHINQRRGFLSNRKEKKNKANDFGKIKTGISEAKRKIEESGARTLGEYLYKEIALKQDRHVPLRFKAARNEKNKIFYPLYPERHMLECEVKELFKSQRRFYPDELSPQIEDKIVDIIFYQRALKPQEPGFCTFEKNEKRIPKASPLFQQFRIHQDVNHLELWEREIAPEEREKIKTELSRKEKMTFEQIRKLLKLKPGAKFSFETEKRKDLPGNKTSALLSAPECFGERWFSWNSEKQDEIVRLILNENDERKLIDELQQKYACTYIQAQNIADLYLEDGYANLSKKAISRILPYLKQGQRYNDACKSAGYHHSVIGNGELLNELPYYGKALPHRVIGGTFSSKDEQNPEKFYGKINNPTVHVGLNQLGKLVNELIKKYGEPEEIVVELARELKLSIKERRRIEKEQKENQEKNKAIDEKLAEIGVPQKGENRMIYKIWESLAEQPQNRRCPFTGKQIPLNRLFSGEFQEEHLVPFSRSYNDSINNKVIAHHEANAFKNNRTPYEAFGHSPGNYQWDEIYERAKLMPQKLRFFQPNVLEKLKGGENDIIARQLTDTQYFARVAREYLSLICKKVWSSPGRLTAMLRSKWGLDTILGNTLEKNRSDHRQHAIDAFVIACTSRGTLQKIAEAAENSKRRNRLIEKMPPPFDGFDRSELETKIANMIVSHKPDHGTSQAGLPTGKTTGRLHDETAYGLAGNEKKGYCNFVHRIKISEIESQNNLDQVRDPVWRDRLKNALEGIEEESDEWKKTLDQFSKTHRISKIRIVEPRKPETMVGIYQKQEKGKTGAKPYKYYALGGNHCADIFCTDKGKNAGKWQCEIISTYWANQKGFIPEWRKNHPTAKLIMRLFAHDMVAVETNGKTQIFRVQKLNLSNCTICFREHFTAESPKQYDFQASAYRLQLKKARKVSVDILGGVKDPFLAKLDGGTDYRNRTGRTASLAR